MSRRGRGHLPQNQPPVTHHAAGGCGAAASRAVWGTVAAQAGLVLCVTTAAAPLGATPPACAVARVVLIDETSARRLAEQVARQCFMGTGSGGSPLVYSRIELRADPGPAAPARWWVWIPETRNHIEPSGLYLTLDAATGTWVRRRVE